MNEKGSGFNPDVEKEKNKEESVESILSFIDGMEVDKLSYLQTQMRMLSRIIEDTKRKVYLHGHEVWSHPFGPSVNNMKINCKAQKDFVAKQLKTGLEQLAHMEASHQLHLYKKNNENKTEDELNEFYNKTKIAELKKVVDFCEMEKYKKEEEEEEE